MGEKKDEKNVDKWKILTFNACNFNQQRNSDMKLSVRNVGLIAGIALLAVALANQIEPLRDALYDRRKFLGIL